MIDKCIQCGNDTTYNVEDHIDYRVGYVEGAGQLCINCLMVLERFPENSKTITVTAAEVLGTPNDLELGALVRKKYWQL